jgi:hypothetical protein
MFNLYVEVDPNNESNLLIETRDTFYSQGWRHKGLDIQTCKGQRYSTRTAWAF